MKPTRLLLIRRVICLCMIAWAIVVTVVFMIAQLRLAGAEVMRDYGEGHTFWMAREVLNPAYAYKPLDSLPYAIFPYPPLYLLLSNGLGALWGDLLLAGRSISLASTVGIALVLGGLVALCIPRSFSAVWRWGFGALAVSLVFTTESVMGWASLMRVDMLGLLLMYAGLAVYILAGKRISQQYLAVTLFMLAAFAKQTLLSAPLACAVFGLFACPKATFRVFGYGIAAGLAGLLFCHFLTDAGFLKNILSYNLNPFSWGVVGWQLSDHLRTGIVIRLVLSVVALASFWKQFSAGAMRWKQLLLFRTHQRYSRAVLIGSLNACFAFVLALSIGKMGSVYNFFLAWDLSLCLLSVLALLRLFISWRTDLPSLLLRMLVFLLLTGGLFVPTSNMARILTEDFAQQKIEEEEMIALVRNSSGPVLSDHMQVVTRAGRPVEVEPATLSFLTRAGGWNEQPFLDLFEQKYFRLIITTPLRSEANRYSPAVIRSIEKNYLLDGKTGDYLVYMPRP